LVYNEGALVGLYTQDYKCLCAGGYDLRHHMQLPENLYFDPCDPGKQVKPGVNLSVHPHQMHLRCKFVDRMSETCRYNAHNYDDLKSP